MRENRLPKLLWNILGGKPGGSSPTGQPPSLLATLRRRFPCSRLQHIRELAASNQLPRYPVGECADFFMKLGDDHLTGIAIYDEPHMRTPSSESNVYCERFLLIGTPLCVLHTCKGRDPVRARRSLICQQVFDAHWCAGRAGVQGVLERSDRRQR